MVRDREVSPAVHICIYAFGKIRWCRHILPFFPKHLISFTTGAQFLSCLQSQFHNTEKKHFRKHKSATFCFATAYLHLRNCNILVFMQYKTSVPWLFKEILLHNGKSAYLQLHIFSAVRNFSINTLFQLHILISTFDFRSEKLKKNVVGL